MKYAPSIAFEEMSGSAKGVTAAKAKGRKYLRNRGYGKKTSTASQSTVKGIFKQLSQPIPARNWASSSRRWAARSTPPAPRPTTPASSSWSSA